MNNNIKAYREKSRLTQEGLANLAGVSRQSIISIEKGYYIPTTILALKMAVVLKTSVEYLFELEKKDWK